MHQIKKYGGCLLVVCAFLVAVLLSVPGLAATTLTRSVTVSPGKVLYIVNKDISASQILSNSITVQVASSSTRYDIVFAGGNTQETTAIMAINIGSGFRSAANANYIKSSASDNSGSLLGIMVRSGKVKITITSVTNSQTFGLTPMSRTSKVNPIKMVKVAKKKKINLSMTSGNLAKMPLIMMGTTGSKMKRVLSTASKTYEQYKFTGSGLNRTTYQNGKKVSSVNIRYDTGFSDGGKGYKCARISVIPSNVTKSSGWMQTISGDVAYGYMSNYIGMKYKIK